MANFTTTIDTNASPHAVYAYLIDFSRATEWDPSVVEAERLDAPEQPPLVGSKFRLVVAFFGRRVELQYALNRAEPDSLLEFVADMKRLRSCDTITIRPAGSGSQVTYDALLELKGPAKLLDRGLALIFDRIGHHAAAGLERQLATLS
jgi:hypothetical protein